jgi:hypothetical protein
MWPFTPSARPADPGIRAVGIERQTDSKGRTRYRVVTKGAQVRAEWSGTDLLEARRRGERLAAELNLPLHDESTGRLRSREPGELDLPLGDRLRLAGDPPARPSLPPGSRLRWQPGTVASIEFPGQRLSPLFVLLWLAFPAFFLAAFWFLASPLVVAIGALLFVPFGWALVVARRPKHVVIDGTGIEVRYLGYQRRIAFLALEESVLASGKIHLLSDDADAVIADWSDSLADLHFVSQVIEEAAYCAAAPRGARPPEADPRGPKHVAPVEVPPSPSLQARPPAPRSPRRKATPEQAGVLGIVFLVVGFAGVAGGGYLALSVRDFVERATPTLGTVVALSASGGARGRVYRPVVRFVPPGGSAVVVTGSIGSNPPSYEVGEEVEVRYEPGDEVHARVGSLRKLWAAPVLVTGFGVLFGLMGLFVISAYRKGAIGPGGNIRVG